MSGAKHSAPSSPPLADLVETLRKVQAQLARTYCRQSQPLVALWLTRSGAVRIEIRFPIADFSPAPSPLAVYDDHIGRPVFVELDGVDLAAPGWDAPNRVMAALEPKGPPP